MLAASRLSLALGAGCALALAAAALLKAAAALQSTPAAPKVQVELECYLQRDEEEEHAAEAKKRLVPVGARVVLDDGRGVGEVRGYNEAEDAYDVQLLLDGGGSSSRVRVSSGEIAQPRVSELHIYPIKSCGGIRLESAQVTDKGLLHDREWMFVDDMGRFMTQRHYRKLALVRPKLVPSVENTKAIILAAEGMPELEVPIIHESQGKELTVRLWKDTLVAIDQGDAAAQWINTFLEDKLGDRKLRFVHFKESFVRPCRVQYAPGYQTGFSDAFPILLTAEASLADLNKLLRDPIPMDRFRANVVLEGSPAWAEDYWNALFIGPLKFRNVGPRGRCNIPCIDQETATSHPGREPSRTLMKHRNGVVLGFQNSNKSQNFFGSSLVVEKMGRLKIGDSVKILTMKKRVVA